MKVEVLVRKSLDGALQGIAPAKENGVYLPVPPGMERIAIDIDEVLLGTDHPDHAQALLDAVRIVLRDEKRSIQQ